MCFVDQLPKTRSGKVLRKNIRGLADGKPVPVPSPANHCVMRFVNNSPPILGLISVLMFVATGAGDDRQSGGV